jgi:hypothetical protein
MTLKEYLLRALKTGPMTLAEIRAAEWMKGKSENGLNVLLTQLKRAQIIYSPKRGSYALVVNNPEKYNKNTEKGIEKVFNSVRDMVIAKNKRYGDSALNPLRLFSKADPVEQLRVRLDDKISRIMRGSEGISNDADIYRDIMGYCALLLLVMEE